MGVFTSPLFWLWMLTCVTMAAGKIKLVDNGYEGVVIAIRPEVKENEMILSRLEAILTKSSAMLFRATRNHLYFREFIVVIPESWEGNENYDNAVDTQLAKQHIIIDKANPASGNTPYVMMYTTCGKSGQYLHLTPDYILYDDVSRKYGTHGKAMVHEWAHLRWGIFDEYVTADVKDSPFYLYRGEWLPTRCSTTIGGLLRNSQPGESCEFDPETGKPSKNCWFYPSTMNEEGASLMYAQYLENVVEFCDDPKTAPDHLKHNMLAPNRQNRMCHYKSAWEVMRDHEDFGKDTKELPRTTNTKPVFKYVQVNSRRRVLVLDTSGSMKGTPLNDLRQASSSFINSVEHGSQLGIVHFAASATTICPLQEVKSEDDKKNLMDCLPYTATGATSIGSGLRMAKEVLNPSCVSTGGTIILITDGEENRAPFIADVKEELVNKSIVVESIAYGQGAEIKIASLASDTGGNTFFYSGDPNSTALIDGLSAIVEKENSMLPEESVSHSILTDAGSVSRDSNFTDSFYIDSTIGRDTSLTFSYTELIDVTISGPDGVYTADTHYDNFRYDTKFNILKVPLKPDPSPGKWTYVIATKSTQSSSFTVNIQSKARSKGQDIIKVSSWIAEEEDIVFDGKTTLAVYAEVLRGRAPMLKADVLATIERPQASPLDLVLLDNGIGADIIKSDGVYSANILAKDMTGNGRYNIKVKVAGIETKTEVIIGGGGANSGAFQAMSIEFQTERVTAPAENFQRVTSAGEFRLQGFDNWDPELDVMPPARIADFQLKSFDYKKSLSTLTWTSVGDDMERGSASKYTIFVSEDFDEILNITTSSKKFPSEHIIQGNPDTPLKPGEREEFVLRMSSMQSDETVYMSIIAIDDAGNSGEPSNVISISPGLKLAVPRVAVSTGEEFPMFIIVIAAVALFLIAIIILGTCLVIRWRKIKQEKNRQRNDTQDAAIGSHELHI